MPETATRKRTKQQKPEPMATLSRRQRKGKPAKLLGGLMGLALLDGIFDHGPSVTYGCMNEAMIANARKKNRRGKIVRRLRSRG